MEKLDFNLPTKSMAKVYIGDDCRSNIFKKRGINASITDYATVLSCIYTGEEKKGSYWLDAASEGDSLVVSPLMAYAPVNKRIIGVRPIIKYSSIKDMCSDTKICEDGITETYFGSYPCNIADKHVSRELEKIYDYNRCIGAITGKEYTIDRKGSYEDHKRFLRSSLYEYEYEGKKYVRVPVNSYLSHSEDGVVLSDNNYYKNGSYVWLEVTPHKLLVDETEDLAVFENIILAGIQFNRRRNYKGDFNRTNIKKYLDKYFSKEILPKYVDSDLKQRIKSL